MKTDRTTPVPIDSSELADKIFSHSHKLKLTFTHWRAGEFDESEPKQVSMHYKLEGVTDFKEGQVEDLADAQRFMTGLVKAFMATERDDETKKRMEEEGDWEK